MRHLILRWLIELLGNIVVDGCNNCDLASQLEVVVTNEPRSVDGEVLNCCVGFGSGLAVYVLNALTLGHS